MIGFWREKDENGVLCNWYHAEFDMDGKHFINSEQAYMYKKAELFGDTEHMEKLLTLKSPMSCKSVGRAIKPFDQEVFDKHKFDFMVEVNHHKYSQNPELKAFLLSTGDEIICEASPKDTVWGIGLSMDDPNFNDPSKWRGENLLGKALMKVREMLRDEGKEICNKRKALTPEQVKEKLSAFAKRLEEETTEII